MVNKSGHIGTATETATVRAIKPWFPNAERRRLRGVDDWGDITGTPGIVWEVKGGRAARTASDMQIEAWLEETWRERNNAGADIGVLVVPRKGIGPVNAARWWAIFDKMVVRSDMAPRGRLTVVDGPVRMHLHDACQMLKDWGY
jgi:hypothetical protein